MARKPQNELTLGEKIELINDSEANPKLSLRELAEKYKIGKSNAGRILQKKEDFKAKWHENETSSKRKRKLRDGETRQLNDLLKKWFDVARSKNLPVSGPLIQEKARKFAETLELDDFVASNGWLDRWRKAYNIDFGVLSGESGDVDDRVVDEFRDKIPEICEGFLLKDIFNIDETGLFYKGIPNKSLKNKAEKSHGGKFAKERISVALFCNADGTEKETAFVIGRYARPHAFKNLDLSRDLPVVYRNNMKAWMTTDLFSEIILKFDKKMRSQKRKVLVFLDNAVVHHSDELERKLKNTKLVFFPANTTSKSQPLDQGIIWSFKSFYRKLFLSRMASEIDSALNVSALVKSITILDAVHWISLAWSKVTQVTIRNCFIKCGFPEAEEEGVEREPESEEISLEYLMGKLPADSVEISAEEYLSVDQVVPATEYEVSGADFDDELLDMFLNPAENLEVSDGEEEELEVVAEFNVTHTQAKEAIYSLRKYAESQEPKILREVLQLQEKFTSLRLERQMQASQKLITDWFHETSNSPDSPETSNNQEIDDTDNNLSRNNSPIFAEQQDSGFDLDMAEHSGQFDSSIGNSQEF